MMETTLLWLFWILVFFVYFPFLATTKADGVANKRSNHEEVKENFIVAANNHFY